MVEHPAFTAGNEDHHILNAFDNQHSDNTLQTSLFSPISYF